MATLSAIARGGRRLVAMGAGSTLGAALGSALDWALPAVCLSCGGRVAEHGALCGPCWMAIERFPPGAVALHDGPSALGEISAVFRYGEGCRPLILGFKHGDRLHGAPAFGRWIAAQAGDLLARADLVAPVPLHRRRLIRRRYNQSALLARAAAREARVALAVDLLIRTRDTPTQGGRTREGRRRNVAGAFALHPAWATRVEGARVVLIDDVATSGATLEACALALREAGARAVDAAVLARARRRG